MSGNDDAAAIAIGATLGGASIALFAGAGSWLAIQAYRAGQFSRGLRRMNIWVLGGVTTLDQALDYDCAMCGHRLDQREQVRTLSCGHVFHLRKGDDKCVANTVDDWLRENRMRCPACCKVVSPVLPCKAPPTSPPPPAPTPAQSSGTSTDLEAQQPGLPALQHKPRLQPPHGPHLPPLQWFQDALRFRSPRRSSDA